MKEEVYQHMRGIDKTVFANCAVAFGNNNKFLYKKKYEILGILVDFYASFQ